VVPACGGGSGDDDDDADSAVPPPPPPTVCTEPASPVDTSAPDHVVGDGSAASCTEAELRAAVDAGGTITFACGAEPATIVLTAPLVVTADTVIDGGGLISISGGDAVRILEMDTGNFEALSPHLTVQHLTLRDGHATGALTAGGGGAIYYVGGSVTAIDATFLDNAAEPVGQDVAGGAIFGIGLGETVVVGSVFSGNQASNGGAIGALGSGVTIVNTTLSANQATGFGANPGNGGNGGALSMDGENRAMILCGDTFESNSSGALGGAIFRTGYHTETNQIDRSAFLDNESRDGEDSGAGAIYLQGVHVAMTGTTIANNRAAGSAGLWVLAHGDAPAICDLTNVTITGNSTFPRADFTTRGVSAGLTIGDGTTGTLLNVTITGNAAQFGSGIWNASPLVIRNSIIANDAENEYTPLNCTGSQYASPPATGENNVQWPNGIQDDMDCTAGITRVDPMMGDLGDHGGPTPTVLPGNTSLPTGTGCPPTDQRGDPRGDPCTIGAVEP
jgi:hypothetical protein